MWWKLVRHTWEAVAAAIPLALYFGVQVPQTWDDSLVMLTEADEWLINHAKYPGLFLLACCVFALSVGIPRGLQLAEWISGKQKEKQHRWQALNGAEAIFDTQERLSFAEISRRWAATTHEPGYRFEENYTRLLRAFWEGDFEIKNVSILKVVHPIEMQHHDERLKLSDTITPIRLAISHELPFRDDKVVDYMWRHAKDSLRAGRFVTPANEMYDVYASMRYHEYDPKAVRVIWDALTLDKKGFMHWIANQKRLPKEWMA
jgi:hypothetical protein